MRILLVLILCCFWINVAGQNKWVVKAGIHASAQIQQNVPGMDHSGVKFLDGSSSGGYQKMVFSGLVAHDWTLTSRIGLQAGIGYRQSGFLSIAQYQQNKGYSIYLPDSKTENNLFHYASSELSIQFKTAPKRTVGYFRIGNRFDYLIKFKSKFWGDNYGYLNSFDYHAFAAIGVEYSLKKRWFSRHKPQQELFSIPTILFIEFEGAPPLYNVDKDKTRSTPFVQIVDSDGNIIMNTPYRVRKLVQNYSAGFVVGVKF